MANRIARMGAGKIVLVGFFGLLWLFMLMLIVVGTATVLTMKSWLPKVVEQAVTHGRRTVVEGVAEVERTGEPTI